MKVEELKEQARRHEQREEWKKAFDLYTTALRIQDEDEPPDITLFNRVGDIQTRLGQIDGAVEQYEKAIELYLEAELPNNAIAICKKVLRNLPDRNIFFLRIGQIRAGQGFITDARQSFLTYAERQTVQGDVDSALNALIEFVGLSPEDVEIRKSLASQLESQGRKDEAIEQYMETYRHLLRMERIDEASALSEQLLELAPDVVLPDPDSFQEDELQGTEELILESTSLGGLELVEWEDDDASGSEGVEVEPADSPMEEVVGGTAEEEEVALPTFDFDSEEAAEEAEVLSSFSFEEGRSKEVEVEDDPLPLIGFESEMDGESDDDEALEDSLPLLGSPDEAEELVLETPLEAAMDDAAFETAREDFAEAETEDSLASPEELQIPAAEDYQEAAARGEMDLAIGMVKTLLEVEPDDVELHQRMVEYAFRSNDQVALASAYLKLAECLARTGAPVKARAVYQQVLSLSPGHEGARAGLQDLDGTGGAEPPVEVASSEEYVDLGAMILGEDAEKTTRWTVAAEAPSGDEAADFAKMLGQFKEKVSEHLAADDVVAHHDLGTAYMEMGLLDEAVGEFQMALRASPSHLPTHEVMGRCWMEMGKPDMAIRALNRALQSKYDIEDEVIGIYYLMGLAQEAQGNTSEAVEFYEKVFSLDINFEDVTERLRALR